MALLPRMLLSSIRMTKMDKRLDKNIDFPFPLFFMESKSREEGKRVEKRI